MSDAPIRIVHLLETLDPAGTERAVLELVLALDPRRFENAVWFLRGKGWLRPEFENKRIKTRKIGLGGPWDLSVVPRLTWALRRSGASVLHTHHPVASAFGRLALPHGGVRGVLTTEHAVHHWSQPSRFVNKLVRATAGRAYCVVCVSRAVEYLSAGAGALLPGKSRIIHDGVSPHDVDPEKVAAARRRFELPETGPVVGTLARLEPHKGLSTLIEAMPLILAERADARFAIGGHGPEKEPLEAKARDLHVLDRLRFIGPVPDPHAFLPAVDVFVMPSLTEGFGIGALEAMAHGIPVIATRVGGLAELLENGAGGLLINPNAPRELASVVLYLLSSKLYASEIGSAGRRRAADSAVLMAQSYAELYEEAVGIVDSRRSSDSRPS